MAGRFCSFVGWQKQVPGGSVIFEVAQMRSGDLT
jgi:hypothetical protein